MRTSKIYCLSNFELYMTVSLTIAPMCYTPQDNLIYNGTFVPFDHLHSVTFKGNHSMLEIVQSSL